MLAEKIRLDLENSSWIRAMFEEGERLRKIHGASQVYDFSLGNPDYESPQRVRKTLQELVADGITGMHRYTPNAGVGSVRELVAARVSQDSGLQISPDMIVMTCGAAGGLNVLLKAILNPGDEVIVFTPYFVEYHFYVDNHGGRTVRVPSDENFLPDLKALERAITPATRAIIINSPNNPTGVVYSESTLQALAAVIEEKERQLGVEVLLISDEPYSKLVYDGLSVPPTMKYFRHCATVNSFSKSLALPGARIGYIALSPGIPDLESLIAGLVFANRILGFVNAPSVFQHLVAACLDDGPDVEEYQKRRDLIYNCLTGLGFSCVKPQGAFYLFPKSPIEDDVAFVQSAVKHNLLLVPGKGFGLPGFFRIAYCQDAATIERSFPAFEALASEYF